jgi:hypothetical protein
MQIQDPRNVKYFFQVWYSQVYKEFLNQRVSRPKRWMSMMMGVKFNIIYSVCWSSTHHHRYQHHHHHYYHHGANETLLTWVFSLTHNLFIIAASPKVMKIIYGVCASTIIIVICLILVRKRKVLIKRYHRRGSTFIVLQLITQYSLLEIKMICAPPLTDLPSYIISSNNCFSNIYRHSSIFSLSTSAR